MPFRAVLVGRRLSTEADEVATTLSDHASALLFILDVPDGLPSSKVVSASGNVEPRFPIFIGAVSLTTYYLELFVNNLVRLKRG